MKVGIILVLVIVGILTASLSYAAVPSLEFGTRFIPSMLIEDKEGVIQVLAKKGNALVPEKIDGLTVTSLDSSILRVMNVKDPESGFTSEVTIKAIKAGSTKIFLAAPGFSSTEIPITIHGNKLKQEQLLVKAVPDNLAFEAIRGGYISVELADEDGFPVVALEDINISLSSSNTKVATLFQENIVIKKGEYFGYTQYTVKDSGTATIYASSVGMESQGEKITVEDEDDLELEFFIFPKTINSNSYSTGHIIAQLQKEDSEEPVIAKNDITIDFKITSSAFGSGSSSDDDILDKAGIFKILKGDYWGYKRFTTLPRNIDQTYTITLSAADPLALQVIEVTTTNNPTAGDQIVQLELFPILATGKRELIGVVHLSNTTSNDPVDADKDLRIRIDTSDKKTVSVDEVIIRKGESSAVVYGNVGPTVLESDLDIRAAAIGTSIINADIFGPDENALDIKAEPLVTKVLAGTDFPIVLYLEDDVNEVIEFPKNYDLFVEPSEFVEIESKKISQGDNYILLKAKSLKEGLETLNIQLDDLEINVSIDSLSSKATTIQLDHSELILVGNNDIFSVQLLNSQGKPVFASEDVEIKFVAEDDSLIEIPNSVIIKKGDYFSLFDVAPKKSGNTKLSLLVEELPLTTFDIKVTDLIPEIDISAPDIIESGEVFVAKISVKDNNNPLSGLEVSWNVNGGIVQLSDSKTGSTGEAIISIIAESSDRVHIEAKVTDALWYSPTQISKTVRVNSTSEFTAFAEDGTGGVEFEKFEVGGFDPLLIIVPAAIVAVGYMMIKRGSITVKNPTEQVKTT